MARMCVSGSSYSEYNLLRENQDKFCTYHLARHSTLIVVYYFQDCKMDSDKPESLSAHMAKMLRT